MNLIKLLMVGITVLFFHSCCKDTSEQPLPNTSINKILPLGASRVEGARPDFESYRYELWKDLVGNDWTFDFIGSRQDNANYATFNGSVFDTDHEGRGGFTSGEILAGIRSWLDITGPPDVVLFSSPGGNDILNGASSLEQTVSNVNAIIDILQESNPNVTILIEELAPAKSGFMTSQQMTNFTAMQQEARTIANQQSTTTSRVISVDMFTGFSDALLADDVHYNTAGADFIATRYYRALDTLLVE